MSSFERMIAIPQEEYVALSSLQNVREPLAQHFQNLEKRYALEEKERDPYRRLMLQSNTLDQLKEVKSQMRNSLAIATPKPYQSRAKALFETLESFIKFNDKGEIYSDDGNLVPGSRLEDLIQHAVRDRRRNLTPTGWSDFLTVLRDHNVPKSILNRNTLDELEGRATPIPESPIAPIAVKTEPSSTQRKRSKLPISNQPIKVPTRTQPARVKKPPASAFNQTNLQFLKLYKDE